MGVPDVIEPCSSDKSPNESVRGHTIIWVRGPQSAAASSDALDAYAVP